LFRLYRSLKTAATGVMSGPIQAPGDKGSKIHDSQCF
jgi:hypothetical protein